MKKHQPRARKPKKRRKQSLPVQAAPVVWTGYYHAGIPNLSVGEYILPASETGHSRTAEFVEASDLEVDDATYSRDYVYVTKDLNWAAARAGLNAGWVYEVEPEGAIEDDPDEDFVGSYDARVPVSWPAISCRCGANGNCTSCTTSAWLVFASRKTGRCSTTTVTWAVGDRAPAGRLRPQRLENKLAKR
jgi:hypothetical protein